MTNTVELKAQAVRKGYTQKTLAKELGLNYQTFQKKLHNKAEIKASEIYKLSQILEIADKESIFFT